ncbi:histone deacetylase [Reticulomyxa filosa]|uniref:histone deacetylase n=1 Tax=Reticulomyxa filosa TaxID=46433 RepID=X6P553_RETFI|nr:histone deacetylase [Reticulomyxa filosa]|eukprot:ETO33248.1 histone deacetylase [Reticulomyxa filosa]
MNRVGLAFHPDCLLHVGPAGLAECPERIESILTSLKKHGLYEQCFILTGKDIPIATKEELLLIHEEALVTKVLTAHKDITLLSDKEYFDIEQDTFYCKHSPRAGIYSLLSLHKLQLKSIVSDWGNDRINGTSNKKKLDSGFAVVRPPGHHCKYDQPMGYCLFNNIVVAVNTIKRRYKHVNKFQRFVVIDWFSFCCALCSTNKTLCYMPHAHDSWRLFAPMKGRASRQWESGYVLGRS